MLQVHKIADLFVKFWFNHYKIEQEFSEYVTSNEEIIDVNIEILNQSTMNLSFSGNLKNNKNQSKIIALSPDFRCVIWENNEYIKFSRLKIDKDNDRAVITLFLDDERNISNIPVHKIRYALMYPFFAFMFFKGIFPLHSCGISLNGIGILISGVSGIGKSSIGKILVGQYGASYLGEDINACTEDGFFWGIPFSKVNNNSQAKINIAIFLGDRTVKLAKEDILDCLMKSEFAVPNITQCYQTAVKIASYMENKTYAFMISRDNYTIEQSALFIYNLMEQLNV